jgi:hypothetical protein
MSSANQQSQAGGGGAAQPGVAPPNNGHQPPSAPDLGVAPGGANPVLKPAAGQPADSQGAAGGGDLAALRASIAALQQQVLEIAGRLPGQAQAGDQRGGDKAPEDDPSVTDEVSIAHLRATWRFSQSSEARCSRIWVTRTDEAQGVSASFDPNNSWKEVAAGFSSNTVPTRMLRVIIDAQKVFDSIFFDLLAKLGDDALPSVAKLYVDQSIFIREFIRISLGRAALLSDLQTGDMTVMDMLRQAFDPLHPASAEQVAYKLDLRLKALQMEQAQSTIKLNNQLLRTKSGGGGGGSSRGGGSGGGRGRGRGGRGGFRRGGNSNNNQNGGNAAGSVSAPAPAGDQ